MYVCVYIYRLYACMCCVCVCACVLVCVSFTDLFGISKDLFQVFQKILFVIVFVSRTIYLHFIPSDQ